MKTSDKERILRLLSYKNLLHRFRSMGFNKVFSENIADSLDISSSLVRKDFSFFDIKGIQKGGYQIDEVLEKISNILGYNEIQNVIIIGTGRIGEALMKYDGFIRDGIRITAAFDTDTHKINKDKIPPVYPMSEVSGYIIKNKIKIALLAVPEPVAQQTVDILQQAGIEGILNFTPLKVRNSGSLVVNNINIGHELANLIYFVKNKSR